MAHANNSIITGKFKGSLGKQFVFGEWEGKTNYTKSPKSKSGDPTIAHADSGIRFLFLEFFSKRGFHSLNQQEK